LKFPHRAGQLSPGRIAAMVLIELKDISKAFDRRLEAAL
jgi:hypothetical protein